MLGQELKDCWLRSGLAYSVLTHEFIIDFLWTDQIAPVLLSKFPDTTPDELKAAMLRFPDQVAT
jgi:hypothetical protein